MSIIKKNFFYNAIYSVIILILPLITAPYISRVMGANCIGRYSYSLSVANVFCLFILLGLKNYGNRTIASVKDNKELLSKTFWSIYGMQFLCSIIVVLIYLGYVCFLATDKTLAWIQVIYIVSAALDINWFFFGLEEFKLTVTRNTIIKIFCAILVFILVKRKEDILIYALILTLGSFITQIILWRFLKKYVYKTQVTVYDIRIHIIPNIKMFVPVIGLSLFTTLSSIMLGAMSNMSEVGYYENSIRITNVPCMAVTSLGTVMLPRMSNLIANGRSSEANQYIQKSLLISVCLSSAVAFGISAVCREFVPFFYGEGFDKCIPAIMLLVIASIFMSWSDVLRTQYLIPHKNDDVYIISTFVGAFINIILNIILIPHLQVLGAVIGRLITEICISIYLSVSIKDKIDISLYFKQSLPFVINGIIMFLIVYFIPVPFSYFIIIVIKAIIGAAIYLFLTLLYYFLKLKKECL